MNACRVRDRVSILSLAALLDALLPGSVRAQGQTIPAPSPDPGQITDGTGMSGAVAVLAIVVGVLVLLAVWVKLYDTRRRREAEAVHIQARISDALIQDQRFSGTVIVPTAEVPLWPRSPLTLVMAGEVPTPELRDAAIRIAGTESARLRDDVQVEDRLMVLPAARRAA
jgi:hypothetical protein